MTPVFGSLSGRVLPADGLSNLVDDSVVGLIDLMTEDFSSILYSSVPTSKATTAVSACIVCLSIGLPCLHNSKTTPKKCYQIFCSCCLCMAVACSSSAGVAISYVLPVLWMTSCFT